MAFQKVEFSFPEDQDEKSIDIEDTSEVEIDLSGKKTADDYADTPAEPEVVVEEPKAELEIEVVDDTPEADRNRKPSNHRLTLQMKSWRGILRRYANVFSTSTKVTTTKGEQKKKRSESGKS